MTIARLESGHPRVDLVLGGGLPRNGINLVVGVPGTGKTILADQYAFHNATPERPAVYFSTISEPLEKLLRYGQRLSFFDTAAVGRSVFYESLGEPLRAGGLDAVFDEIRAQIKQRSPGIIVIDSFRALRAFSDDQGFRAFLHDLSELLTAFPVSAFWIGEYSISDIATAPEFAVADAIVGLFREDFGQREMRFLQVLKLRGSAFLSGKHPCRISSDGVDVFPRLADVSEPPTYALESRRVSSGVAALDGMLGGGLWASSTTLVAGPTGSGKTTVAMSFALEGARAGEPVVLATFQENPTQLERVARGFGWTLEMPSVTLLHAQNVDLYLDEWVYELLEAVGRVRASRLVIDSLGDLLAASTDALQFREYLYSLIQRCARGGPTLLMTLETPSLFDAAPTPATFSHLADNLVALGYTCDGDELRRSVTVVKARASAHSHHTHAFSLTSTGVAVSERHHGRQPER